MIFKKKEIDYSNEQKKQLKNLKKHVSEAIKSKENIVDAAERARKIGFDMGKGILFEEMEASAFNIQSAKMGKLARAQTTASLGRYTDPVDIEIVSRKKVVSNVQAKFSDAKNAAADSVNMQRADKYKGMQRLIRREDNYRTDKNNNPISLLEVAKSIANQRASVEGSIYQNQYKDVADNLTDRLTYKDISTQGTTIKDVKKAFKNPEKYADKIIEKAYGDQIAYEKECRRRANIFGIDFKTSLSQFGNKMDNVKETVTRSSLKNDIVNAGGSLYLYSTGDIDEDELVSNINDSINSNNGVVSKVREVFSDGRIPNKEVLVYAGFSIILVSAAVLLSNISAETQEYQRLAAIAEESAKEIEEFRVLLEKQIEICETNQKAMFNDFIADFEYNLITGENYEKAVAAISAFADKAGFVLEHVDFNEFKEAMNNDEVFVLSKKT